MIVMKIFFHTKSFLKKLFFSMIYGRKFVVGKGTSFRSGFHIVIEGSGHITIGKNCFFNNYCTLASYHEIIIGDGTLFGENVKVYDHNHKYRDLNIPIKEQGYASAPIKIGRHCWISSNVTILKGVEIGDNVVIGAGCVIYEDIPSNVVVFNKQSLAVRQC